MVDIQEPSEEERSAFNEGINHGEFYWTRGDDMGRRLLRAMRSRSQGRALYERSRANYLEWKEAMADGDGKSYDRYPGEDTPQQWSRRGLSEHIRLELEVLGLISGPDGRSQSPGDSEWDSGTLGGGSGRRGDVDSRQPNRSVVDGASERIGTVESWVEDEHGVTAEIRLAPGWTVDQIERGLRNFFWGGPDDFNLNESGPWTALTEVAEEPPKRSAISFKEFGRRAAKESGISKGVIDEHIEWHKEKGDVDCDCQGWVGGSDDVSEPGDSGRSGDSEASDGGVVRGGATELSGEKLDRKLTWIASGLNELDRRRIDNEVGAMSTEELLVAKEEYDERRDLVVRADKYNISIGGIIIRATDEQELRIRGLTPEQLNGFKRIMGG